MKLFSFPLPGSLLLIFLLLFNKANAQSIQISVRDSITNNTLSFATIQVQSSGDSINSAIYSTDKNGQLSIDIKGKDVNLIVLYVGYKQRKIYLKQPVKIEALTIKLSSDAKLLKELQITSKLPSIAQIPEGYLYNVDKGVADLNVNTAQLLKKLPGIVSEQNGELRMQGKPITIFIDGKPSLLSGTELTKFLQTLNLQDVKNLKVMVNPPANYDASGGSIIDISTNKGLLPGISTRIDGSGGTHDKYGSGINLNYKSAKYTGRYNLNYDHSNLRKESGYDQVNKNAPDSLSRYNFKSYTDDNPTNTLSLSINNDFAIDKNNTIGLTLRYNRFKIEPSYVHSELNVFNTGNVLQETEFLNRKDESDSKIYFADLNYRVILNAKGTSLTFDTYYWKRKVTNNYEISTSRDGNDKMQGDIVNNSAQDLSIKSASAGLSHVLNKYITFLSGIKLTSFVVDGQFNNELYQSGQYQPDVDQTYDLAYNEDVYSGYINFAGKYKKLQYSAGLRGEGTVLKLRTTRDNDLTNNRDDFFNLFPVAGIIYPVSAKGSLGLSYSKRIFRVSYSQLNPIDFRTDPSTIQRGNPALKPSSTDNFSLTYSYQSGPNHSYTFTSSYLSEKNPYTWFTLPDSTSGTYINEPVNYKNFKYLTVSLNQQHTVVKWLSLGANLLATRQIYDLKDLNLPNPNSVTSYRASLTADFKFWKNAVFEIFGNFKSKSTTPFGTGAPYRYIDLSASKRFINDDLSITISCNDIFNINRSRYYNNSPFYENSGFLKNETRITQITLSYKFGKTNKNAIKDYSPQEDTRFKN